MREDDEIKDCQWTWSDDGCFLEHDVHHLHPELGLVIQNYRSDSYDGRRVYQSGFSLFGKDTEAPKDFSYLPREIKNRLWDMVFAIKRKFFTDYRPDIVEHFIDGSYSIEKRFERYQTHLAPLGYRIEINKTRRTITYYKQEGGPASNGGPPSF